MFFTVRRYRLLFLFCVTLFFILSVYFIISLRHLQTTNNSSGKNKHGGYVRDVTHALTLDDYDYFRNDIVTTSSGLLCFREGTEQQLDQFIVSSHKCLCKDNWHGNACGIPDVVYRSATPWSKEKLRMRSNPRRIIQAFPFNQEYEMLEMRFVELSDVVDVFLILESNFTAYGTPKPLYLLERLRTGLYPNVARKIVHVFLDFFPAEAMSNGWIADHLLRNYIGSHGLKKVNGLKTQDLFVLTDADELPKREVLQFLRWHDGYSEPILISYQWNVFGFFWAHEARMNHVVTVVTMRAVHYLFRYLVHGIRDAARVLKTNTFDVHAFLEIGGHIGPWTIGNDQLSAGWHCSWCLDLPRIRDKLLSAQNGDIPRWGDYPEKTNENYLRNLIGCGQWFDDVTRLVAVNLSGPDSLPMNAMTYQHLIANIYEQNQCGMLKDRTSSDS